MLKIIENHNQKRWLLKNFQAEEDGAMTIFGLFIFVMMVMGAGIAIDLMRAESDRAELQATVDRAVLAAAALDESDEARAIARNYLRAAGMDEDLIDVAMIENEDGSKSVSFSARSDTESIFIDMFGQDRLTQTVRASANQEYSELEVALVLDISGSMGGNKIASLKREATKFVNDLLLGREDLTTVSIVPYHGLVNLGSTTSRFLPMSMDHDLSNCITFDPATFSETSLPDTGFIQRMPHFDRETGNSDRAGLVQRPHCRSNERGAVIAWSNNVEELTTAINGLSASGWTATDLGAKLGAMLLDPSMQPYLENMIDAGEVDDAFRGRPAAWDKPNLDKVLIIMTDGDNTRQYNLDPDKRSGPSGVFVYREDMVLIPDDVDDVDEDGNLINTCDQNLAAEDANEDGVGDMILLEHDNCDGLAGRWFDGWQVDADAIPVVDGEPSAFTPWWDHRRLDDVMENINTTGNDQTDDNVRFSVYSRDPNQSGFYIPHLEQYQSSPYGGSQAYELSYQELFALYSLNYLANTKFRHADWTTRQHYRRADQWTHDATIIDGSRPLADNSLIDLCEAATQDERINVFTIAFAVSEGSRAERVMGECAATGDPANFIHADDQEEGLAIAFSDILAAIENLRLTQ
ncbi:MAG: pilus assembly protein TadG-related protein [Pseudomonadota bacterium]